MEVDWHSDSDGWGTTDDEAEDISYGDYLNVRRDAARRVAEAESYAPGVKTIQARGNVFQERQVFWPEGAGAGPNEAAIVAMFDAARGFIGEILPKPTSDWRRTPYRLSCVAIMEVDTADGILTGGQAIAVTISDRAQCKINIGRPAHRECQSPRNIVNSLVEGEQFIDGMQRYFFHQFVDSSDSDWAVRRPQWHLLRVLSLSITAARSNPNRGSKHAKLPKWAADKKSTRNPQNKDERCFLWACSLAVWSERTTAATNATPKAQLLRQQSAEKELTALHTLADKNHERIAKYTLDPPDGSRAPLGRGGKPWIIPAQMRFPVAPGGTNEDASVLRQFEEANQVELHIWTCADKPHSTEQLYISSFYQRTVRDGWIRIVLLLYDGHYSVITKPAALMLKQWGDHRNQGGMCIICSQVHASDAAAAKHYEDGYCMKYAPAKCTLPKPEAAFFNAGASDAAATPPCDLLADWDIECHQQLLQRMKRAGLNPSSDGHVMSGVAWMLDPPNADMRTAMETQCPELYAMLGMHIYPETARNDEKAMMRWLFRGVLKAGLLRKRWHKQAQEPLALTDDEEARFLAAERCSITLRRFDDEESIAIAVEMFPAMVEAGKALAVVCCTTLPEVKGWRQLFSHPEWRAVPNVAMKYKAELKKTLADAGTLKLEQKIVGQLITKFLKLWGPFKAAASLARHRNHCHITGKALIGPKPWYHG